MSDTFGMQTRLIEAHDGLFEIRLNGDIVYNNQSACSRVPTLSEALGALAKHIAPLPGKGHRVENPFPTI